MNNTSLGRNILSYLKYMYASNPSQKDLYHQLADQTRQVFGIYDYGANQALDTTFDPNTFDWTETKSLLTDWTNSNNMTNGIMLKDYAAGLAPLLGVSIQEQTTQMQNLQNQGVEAGYQAQQQAVENTNQYAQNIYQGLEQGAKDLAQSQTNFYGNQLSAEETKALSGLNAQKAQYESLLGSDWVNGVLNQLGQMQSSEIDSIDQQAVAAKQSTQAQAEASRTQVNADYTGVIDEIHQAAAQARTMKNEDLNARGMYFSSVLTDALDKISASEIATIGKTEAQRVAKLAKIAADLVTATANIDISTLKSKANITAQYGLQKLSLITQDAQQKAQYTAMLAGLEAQTTGVTDYYKTLQEGLPAYQQMQEAQNLAPIQQAAANQNIQAEGQKNQIIAQQASYVAQEPYNLQVAIQNNLTSYNDYKAKQDQQSFDNYIKQQGLLIDNAKLNLTAQMDAATMQNLASQESLRDAQIWKIHNDASLAAQKLSASGTISTTSIMSLSDANKLVDKQNNLYGDISKLQGALNGTSTTDIVLSDGTTIKGGTTTLSADQKATIQTQLNNDYQLLTLYGNGFLTAKARVLAEYDPDSANALISIQQLIYKNFNATGDNDLDQYSVLQFYKNSTYEGKPLSDYLKNNGYSRADTLLQQWIMTLPQVYKGHG